MTGPPWLHEQKEWSGHWWLPEDPETTVPGVLRYEPDTGPRLSLIGGFESRIMHEIRPGVRVDRGENRAWDVIHGVADNKEITLLDCLPGRTQWVGMGEHLVRQAVHAHTALVGCHLPSKDEAAFAGVEVSVEHMTALSADSVFSVTYGVKKDESLDGRGGIEAKPVDLRRADLGGLTATLDLVHTLPYFEHQRGQHLARMTSAAVVRFEAPGPVPVSTLVRAVSGLRDLVSLASGSACAILWQRLILPPKEDPEFDTRPVLRRRVDDYGQHIVQGNPFEKVSGHHQNLFTFADLPFESLLPRWFEVKAKFEATCNQILGLRYSSDTYLELRLLSAVGAAEAMHRALDPPPPIPEEEFAALRETLLGVTPKPRRTWLASLLQRNEPTLKSRLTELAGRPDREAMSAMLPAPKIWAEAAKEARNTLAHTGRAQAHTLDLLYAVTEATTAVVVANLLYEVGLAPEKLRETVANHQAFQRAARLAREHLSGD